MGYTCIDNGKLYEITIHIFTLSIELHKEQQPGMNRFDRKKILFMLKTMLTGFRFLN